VDNASKALIIAGAILIAVMLVSLGVMLYNTAAGVAETTTGSVEALGVAGFNAQFEIYLGKGKSESQAMGLVSKVISNNAVNDIYVYINYNQDLRNTNYEGKFMGIENLNRVREDISNTKNVRYDISVEEYNQDGSIQTILVDQVAR